MGWIVHRQLREMPGGKLTKFEYEGRMDGCLPDRSYPPPWRVAAAFILVPALAALLVAIAIPLYAGLPNMAERVWRSALVYSLFCAYPPALLFGVPAYFMLRRQFKLRLVNCAIVGGAITALPWAFLSIVSTPDQASIDNRPTVIDGSRTAYGWLTDVEFVGEIALFGAVGGAFFWVVAVAGSSAGKVATEA